MGIPNIYLFPQLSDNYGYFIKNPHATEGVLVDPSDYDMCLKILELNDSIASAANYLNKAGWKYNNFCFSFNVIHDEEEYR